MQDTVNLLLLLITKYVIYDPPVLCYLWILIIYHGLGGKISKAETILDNPRIKRWNNSPLTKPLGFIVITIGWSIMVLCYEYYLPNILITGVILVISVWIPLILSVYCVYLINLYQKSLDTKFGLKKVMIWKL